MNPIKLTLLPSRFLLTLYVGAGIIFGLMPFLVPLSHWLRILISGLIFCKVLYFTLRDALLLLPWSYVEVNVNDKNQLDLQRKDGGLVSVYVQKNTVVTSYLTVLNCQLSQANFLQKLFPPHLVILPDAVNVESYRQLRVWLRWAKLEHTELKD